MTEKQRTCNRQIRCFRCFSWGGPRRDYSAAIAPVGQAPSQAPQSMQASAFTTATPLSMATAPTGQAPSQAPQPTHASETLCAIMMISFRPVRNKCRKAADPCTAKARCFGNDILGFILAKQDKKGKTNCPTAQIFCVFLVGCTKESAKLWPILRENFGKNHESRPGNGGCGGQGHRASSGPAAATTGAGLRTPE